MKFWLATLALASCLTSAVQAQTIAATTISAATKAAPWYQVELFIFSQRDNNSTAEYWKTIESIDISPNAQLLENRRAFKTLKNNQGSIPISNKLMNRQGYHPLFHRVWQQPIQDKHNALPIRITGGEQLADDLFELDGEISLDVARYLHLNTRL